MKGRPLADVVHYDWAPYDLTGIIVTAASVSHRRQRVQLALKGPGGAGTIHLPFSAFRPEALEAAS